MSEQSEHMRSIIQQSDCLYTTVEVDTAIIHMADAITRRLADADPLVLCVMNGGLMVTGRLLPLLPFPLQLDYAHATRYGDQTRGGELLWVVKPVMPLRDRTVLIVDDILDEGHTLAAIVEYCQGQGAREVLTAILVDKLHERKALPGLKGDFVGLEAPDRFLFGCGMDYNGYWRNAPGIYAVKGL